MSAEIKIKPKYLNYFMNKTLGQYKSTEILELKKRSDLRKRIPLDREVNKTQKKPLSPENFTKYLRKQEKLSPDNDLLKKLQRRYKQLEERYMQLLQRTRERNLQNQKNRKQAEKYKLLHEKDQKEIEQLRFQLGLIKKQSVAIQVDSDMLASSDGFRTCSRTNKFDQSTVDDIRLFKNSADKFNSNDKLSANKSSTKRSPVERDTHARVFSKNFQFQKLEDFYSHLNKNRISRYEQKANEEAEISQISKKLSNSPYSKFRFVPNFSKN